MSINSSDTSVSKSKSLEQAVTPSIVSNLSSGEFVGIMADDPRQPIELKAFRNKVKIDWTAIDKEKKEYLPFSRRSKVTRETINRNFEQVKQDVDDIQETVMEKVLCDPSLQHLLVKK